MKCNDLINAKEIFGYNPETGNLWWLKNNRPAGYVNDRGYVVVSHKGVTYKGHRLAWLIHYDKIPKDQIDHINQNKSDNRIVNLRDVTNQINQRNTSLQKNNKSGYAGVCYRKDKKKWIARIMVDRKYINLGYHENKEDAIEIRKFAEDLYGFHDNHGKMKSTVAQLQRIR